MGVGYSSSCTTLSSPSPSLTLHKLQPTFTIPNTTFIVSNKRLLGMALNSGRINGSVIKEESLAKPMFDLDKLSPNLIDGMVFDALVWSSLHGLVVGDRSVQRSGTVAGVGMVHAPLALLPMSFPETEYRQACQLAPIFNELVDRVSLDAKFLQETLSSTKKVDSFTARLLDIHSKMLDSGKKEGIRLGLHRSDYMLDEQTKLLLQIELNTIASSFCGLSGLVSNLHRSLLHQYKDQLELDPSRVPGNSAANGFAEALAKAWKEYNNPRFYYFFYYSP